MSLRSQEMSERIKDAIRHYHKQLDVAETGTVMTVGDGIALVHGLRNAMSSELLLFPNDVYGMVMNLEEEQVGVVLLGDDSKIKEGDVVTGYKAELYLYDYKLDGAKLILNDIKKETTSPSLISDTVVTSSPNTLFSL